MPRGLRAPWHRPHLLGLLVTFFDIDTSAAATARADIYIEAPAHVVWDRLADIACWPAWMGGVQWISALIPLEPGIRFEIRTAHQTVQARVQGVLPGRQLNWSSSALFASARHTVTVEPEGKLTRVSAVALYRGAWPLAMPKQAKRHAKATLLSGLRDLKAISEYKPGKEAPLKAA